MATQQNGLPDSKNPATLPEPPEQSEQPNSGNKKQKKRKKRRSKSPRKASDGSQESTLTSQASAAWSTLLTTEDGETDNALPFQSAKRPKVSSGSASADSAAPRAAGWLTRKDPTSSDAPQQQQMTVAKRSTPVEALPQTITAKSSSSAKQLQKTALAESSTSAKEVPEPRAPSRRERLPSEASFVGMSFGTSGPSSRRTSSRHWGGSLFDLSPSTRLDETTLVLGSRASMPEIFGRWGPDDRSPERQGAGAATGGRAAESLQRPASPKDGATPSRLSRGPRRLSAVRWLSDTEQTPDRRSAAGTSAALSPGHPTKGARTESEMRAGRAPHAAVRVPRSARVGREEVAVACSLCCTFWLTSLGVLLLFWGHAADDRDDPLCKTEDCVRHAELIAAITAATNVDPCEDFGAYVCSALSPPASLAARGRAGHPPAVPSAMDAAVYAWLDGLGETLRNGSSALPAGRKPLKMYELCMGGDDSRHYGADPTEFLRFLREVGLSWPEDPPKGVDAISVFVSLAFNYEAPAWFSVAVAESPSGSQDWRLVVSPDRYTSALWAHHKTTVNSGAYVSFWQGMWRSLMGDSAASLDDNAINKTAAMEDDILWKLYRALTKPLKRTALSSLAELANYTTSISSASWFRALTLSLPLRPTLATEIFLTDVAYLRTIGDLFATYDDQKLVRHLSWSFVKMYGPVVNPQLFVDRLEDAKIALLYRPLFCGVNVEVPYRLLVSALYFVARISDHDKASVDATFDSLILAAAEKVSNSSWLDADSKHPVEAKIKAVNASIWPDEELLRTDVLEAMHEEFPEDRSSFSAYWVASRRAIRRAKSRTLYRRHSVGPIGSEEPYLTYDAVANSVLVALGALVAPLYYRNGTRGALYGGIGFLMALEIVKSIDREGLRWDPNGNAVDSFLSQLSLEEFVLLNSCPGRGQRQTAFPEIPALEVAYAALQRALKKDGRRYRIARHLSEEKVFFITLCYVTCALRGTDNHTGTDCNKAVKNFPEFARAFSCPRGSKMNPRTKCVFFN
ncbi:endothelin-converting enzyme 1-like isoform X2 [Dermacentor albipictus]|uniref:endothelin-converting enzyme 1-like isoform X2 n=1 Tax=Dermacentor albipictus TaxID=60249 RepID=UPI0031FC320E